MSQPTMNPGGTAVAEAPPPILPGGVVDDVSVADNRRKLLVVGVALAVLVVAVVAFFLLKSGGSSNDAALSTPVPHLPHKVTATTKTTPVTAEEALRRVDRMVAAYGADNVPIGSLQPGQGGVADRSLTRAELVDEIAHLIEKLREEKGGDNAATITALRAAVTNPKTIQAIAADPRSSRETLSTTLLARL